MKQPLVERVQQKNALFRLCMLVHIDLLLQLLRFHFLLQPGAQTRGRLVLPLLRSHFLLQPGAKTRGCLVLPLLRSQFLPQPGAQTTSRKQSLLIPSFFRSFLRLFCPAVHELGTVLFELRQGSPSLRREIFLPVGCASLLAPSSVLALGSLLTLLAALPSLTLSLALSFRALGRVYGP